MVLDSSAIVAIFLKEPGFERFLQTIDAASVLVVGAPTLLETALVLSSRLGRDAQPLLFAFRRRFQIETIAFTEEHLDVAMDAFLKFGRGRHRASLNYGDCMSYAIAVVARMPLLYTGDDFSKTDLETARRS